MVTKVVGIACMALGVAAAVSTSSFRRLNSIPVGATWLNRAWGVSGNPTSTPDEGQQVVTLNMYNGLSEDQVEAYQDKGKFVICYTSAGHIFEHERDDYPEVPVVSRVSDGYGGKRYWIDITKYELAGRWIGDKLNEAKSLGCDAVELDNEDCWEYSDCHPDYPRVHDPTLKQAQLRMLHSLASKIHSRDLQGGLKNEATLVALDPSLVDAYDFSIVENCNHYCEPFEQFIEQGKAVLSVQNVKYRYNNVANDEDESLTTLACRDAEERGFTRLTDFNGSGWQMCK